MYTSSVISIAFGHYDGFGHGLKMNVYSSYGAKELHLPRSLLLPQYHKKLELRRTLNIYIQAVIRRLD